MQCIIKLKYIFTFDQQVIAVHAVKHAVEGSSILVISYSSAVVALSRGVVQGFERNPKVGQIMNCCSNLFPRSSKKIYIHEIYKLQEKEVDAMWLYTGNEKWS